MGKRESDDDIEYSPSKYPRLEFRVIKKTSRLDSRREDVESRISPDLFVQDVEGAGLDLSQRIPPSGQCTIESKNDSPAAAEQIDPASSQESERIPPSGQFKILHVYPEQEVPGMDLDILSWSPKDSLADNTPFVIIEIGASPTNNQENA